MRIGCDCDVDGSISPHCNSTSGVCQCIENIVGRDCSSCAEGFRNLGGLQCFSCNCSLIGKQEHCAAHKCTLQTTSRHNSYYCKLCSNFSDSKK